MQGWFLSRSHMRTPRSTMAFNLHHRVCCGASVSGYRQPACKGAACASLESDAEHVRRSIKHFLILILNQNGVRQAKKFSCKLSKRCLEGTCSAPLTDSKGVSSDVHTKPGHWWG